MLQREQRTFLIIKVLKKLTKITINFRFPSFTSIPFLLPRQGTETLPSPLKYQTEKIIWSAENCDCSSETVSRVTLFARSSRGCCPSGFVLGNKAFAFLPSNTLHYNALNTFEDSFEPCRMHQTVMPEWGRIK